MESSWVKMVMHWWTAFAERRAIEVTEAERALIERMMIEERAGYLRVAAWTAACAMMALIPFVDVGVFRALGEYDSANWLWAIVQVRLILVILSVTYLVMTRGRPRRAEISVGQERTRGLLLVAGLLFGVAATDVLERDLMYDLDAFIVVAFVVVTFLRLRPWETVVALLPSAAMLAWWIARSPASPAEHQANFGDLAVVVGLSIVVSMVQFPAYVRSTLQKLALYQQGSEFARMNVDLANTNDRLQRLAWLDPLTEIPNRRAFETALTTEWKRALRDGSTLALVMVDIDWFKGFNDTYGHPAGDKCLAAVARNLQGACRRPGDLVTRYGGEEFAVLLPCVFEAGAWAVAETMRRAVREAAIVHAGSSFGYVTVSLGVAVARPAANTSPEALVDAADRALYGAKAAGRDQAMSCPVPRISTSLISRSFPGS
jgi:diguanylate cyclase (GGDEF)-like protein